MAYSLVSGEEMAYYIDLALFLGAEIAFSPLKSNAADEWHNKMGSVPQRIYDDHADQLQEWHSLHSELTDTKKVAQNGYKQYLKSRPAASSESIRRAKTLKTQNMGPHPLLLKEVIDVEDAKRSDFLEEMKKFRPQNVRTYLFKFFDAMTDFHFIPDYL